jgi:hypothetical protein
MPEAPDSRTRYELADEDETVSERENERILTEDDHVHQSEGARFTA